MRVVAAAERERSEVEGGGPALRVSQERRQICRLEVDPGHAEHRRALAASHGQVGGADLDDLALRAEAADRQRGLPTRCQRQLGAGRQRARQRMDELEISPELRVVQHEHRRSGLRLQCRGRAHQRILVRHRVWARPDEGPAVALRPLGEEGCLPVAGGCTHQHERDLGRLHEQAQEAVAAHCSPAQSRRREVHHGVERVQVARRGREGYGAGAHRLSIAATR